MHFRDGGYHCKNSQVVANLTKQIFGYLCNGERGGGTIVRIAKVREIF